MLPTFPVLSIEPVVAAEGGDCCRRLFCALSLGDRLGGVAGVAGVDLCDNTCGDACGDECGDTCGDACGDTCGDT